MLDVVTEPDVVVEGAVAEHNHGGGGRGENLVKVGRETVPQAVAVRKLDEVRVVAGAEADDVDSSVAAVEGVVEILGKIGAENGVAVIVRHDEGRVAERDGLDVVQRDVVQKAGLEKAFEHASTARSQVTH